MKSHCGRFDILVDDEDLERCIQYATNQQNKEGLWSVRKKKNTHYASSESNGVFMSLHRFVMNAKEGFDIDHQNHEGLDNRKQNLREATDAQTCQNRLKTKGKSIYKGVTVENGKYRATIWIKRKKIYLGMFQNEADAALAYNKAAKLHWGEFANLNAIPNVFCMPVGIVDTAV